MRACFSDGNYTWHIIFTATGTGGIYTAIGTVSVAGVRWPVRGKGLFPTRDAGNVQLRAYNPSPGNCDVYVDSFLYNGTGVITGYGSDVEYKGTGTFVKYCGGNIVATGVWAASGPCGSDLNDGSGPARNDNSQFIVAVSPNPLRSNSTLTFNLAKESKVLITVYNSKLQPVKQIVNRTESPGRHSYIIDGSSLTNGVYRVITTIDGKPYSSLLQVVK